MEVGFIYIKNEGLNTECEKDIMELLLKQKIEILKQKELVLTEQLLRMHQPIIFTSESETEFWKHQSVERMLDKKVKMFMVKSQGCIAITNRIKRLIRSKYTKEYDVVNKISYPTYMHAASTLEEVERDVFVLMPDQLELLHKINGIHDELTKQLQLSTKGK